MVATMEIPAAQRDVLFLLKHDFLDEGGKFYCPECAQINGVLSYYPELRHVLDVRYVDFQRPRPGIIAMVGEENQSCPVLVVAPGAAFELEGVTFGEANQRRFVSGAEEIGKYLSAKHGVGLPH